MLSVFSGSHCPLWFCWKGNKTLNTWKKMYIFFLLLWIMTKGSHYLENWQWLNELMYEIWLIARYIKSVTASKSGSFAKCTVVTRQIDHIGLVNSTNTCFQHKTQFHSVVFGFLSLKTLCVRLHHAFAKNSFRPPFHCLFPWYPIIPNSTPTFTPKS